MAEYLSPAWIEEMADALLSEVLDGSPTDDDVSLLLVRLPA